MFGFFKRRPTSEQTKVESLDLPPKFPLPSVLSLSQATQTAIEISSSFESHDGFASVVGNFDGEGLTCGALGFTWKYGRQQDLIIQCEVKHPGLILKYMPSMGRTFLSLAKMPIGKSFPSIVKMSDHAGQVLPAIKSELKVYWGSPEMVEIQVQEANDMAKKASAYCNAWNSATENTSVTLHEFCFFFDMIVQNGSLDDLTYMSVKNYVGPSIKMAFVNVIDFCERNSNRDSKQNARLWEKIFPLTNLNQQRLVILAYLRAERSAQAYAASVMNRRGSIALMQGYVNRSLRDFSTQYPSLLADTVK